ncbi:MAG: phosphoribosyl-ATP diphosphatase [Clostridiales Family XIII bacterium]|jgi:phosphoribosyl-ATP pyrophosphohydrolase|nr:phosphoribosyl-ATP diphosphatase [Clostridiales Family XIII bacterium]
MGTDSALQELYDVVQDRKKHSAEGSYTCYLFEQGLDKILKKCGEECSETIIAAKTLEYAQASPKSAPDAEKARADAENEVCDLLYHLTVLLVQLEIPLKNIEDILKERSGKIGNLKAAKKTDLNS